MLKRIGQLGDGVSEIPCHPGRVDSDLKALSTLTYIRELELEVLTDPGFGQRLIQPESF